MAFGTFAFAALNGWALLHSLWFWFATLSTIGFGDAIFPFNSISKLKGESNDPGLAYFYYFLFIFLGIVAVGYLFSSAIEFVSLSSQESKEEIFNSNLKQWREHLRLLHGRNDVTSDNESINLVFETIDHEDQSPCFTINRKEITVPVRSCIKPI